MARVEVRAHPLGADDEPVDEPGEAVEHVVEREERVGEDDPLGRGVGDVALVPEGDVLEPDRAAARTTRASPQIRSATIGLRLCGIADEPFWPAANGSSTSRTSVRARWRISSANRLERGGHDRERREQLGVPVALEDLRRDRLGLEPEPLAGDPLHLGVGGRVGADRARELADAHRLERARRGASGPRSSSNAQPASLRPNVVGSAWTPCVRPMQIVSPVLLGARDDRAASARSSPSSERARPPPGSGARARCRRRRRRSGRSGASAPPRRAAPRPRRRRRRCRGRSRASISATRSGVGGVARARIAATASAGTTPSSAQPSSAASSTSSQRSSLLSSDQTLAMAGRE